MDVFEWMMDWLMWSHTFNIQTLLWFGIRRKSVWKRRDGKGRVMTSKLGRAYQANGQANDYRESHFKTINCVNFSRNGKCSACTTLLLRTSTQNYNFDPIYTRSCEKEYVYGNRPVLTRDDMRSWYHDNTSIYWSNSRSIGMGSFKLGGASVSKIVNDYDSFTFTFGTQTVTSSTDGTFKSSLLSARIGSICSKLKASTCSGARPYIPVHSM